MTQPTGPTREPGLNPSLKSRREDTYDTANRTPSRLPPSSASQTAIGPRCGLRRSSSADCRPSTS